MKSKPCLFPGNLWKFEDFTMLWFAKVIWHVGNIFIDKCLQLTDTAILASLMFGILARVLNTWNLEFEVVKKKFWLLQKKCHCANNNTFMTGDRNCTKSDSIMTEYGLAELLHKQSFTWFRLGIKSRLIFFLTQLNKMPKQGVCVRLFVEKSTDHLEPTFSAHCL